MEPDRDGVSYSDSPHLSPRARDPMDCLNYLMAGSFGSLMVVYDWCQPHNLLLESVRMRFVNDLGRKVLVWPKSDFHF